MDLLESAPFILFSDEKPALAIYLMGNGIFISTKSHIKSKPMIDCGESLFLSKDFPCSQRGNPQKYRDKFKFLRKPQPSCSP